MKTENILGYPVTSISKGQCCKEILHEIDFSSKARYLVCVNPHSLEVARKDCAFANAMKNADVIVPDGIGIVIASKIFGGDIRKRVTGTDVFLGLNGALNDGRKYSCFFLGSTEQNLIKIKKKVGRDFPHIRVAGTYSPPFQPEFTEEDSLMMIEAVNRLQPDVLWVGMTAPKQEKWIYQNKDRLNVKFIGAVGAVFDFYAGTVKRPPPWFLDHGLEWLPRLLREPQRLWRRNFISTPLFLFHVIQARLQMSFKH